jgi:hypothetical protein
MYGIIDSEFVNIAKVDCGLIFECALLVMNEKFEEVDIHHWNVNYNLHKYSSNRWYATMKFINKQGWYERPIMPYSSTGVSLNFVQSKIATVCDFMNIKVVFVKGDVSTDKLLLKKCKEDIRLINLEDFECPKYPNKIHNPANEVRFFSQWMMNNKIDINGKVSIRNSRKNIISLDSSRWTEY